MSAFVHLHTHSYYSLLDGVASPEELIIAAKKQGMRALALTDHNGLYGAVEFYRLAQEYNLRPIIGAELTLNDGGQIVLLVKNSAGYRNLCQLVSQGRLKGGHLQFELSPKEIIKHKEGLILLSGGYKGAINRCLAKRDLDGATAILKRWRDVFGENFYLELQHFDANDTLLNLRLRDLAVEHHVPLVASNDVHFVSIKDWQLRRTLHAIDANSTLEKVQTAGSSEQFLKSAAQMEELFRAFPGALTNTQRIASECRFEFSLGKPVFPSVELPEGESSFSWLWKKSFEGATERYKPLTREVTQRLQYELDVIHRLGFAEYFLIVKDIVDFCHAEHIPCVGRGSAADSLVSYVLQITQVDPIRHNLYFERFLNPERSDPPDIDVDLCWKNRDRVIEYVYDKYSKQRTAMICTFNTFQNRSAIRDVAKTHGLPEDEIGRITKYLPHSAISDVEEVVNTLPEMRELRHNLALYEEILRTAQRIADFPRHLSIHPGGVIIAPDNITWHTPLEIAGKGIVIAQYDMYSIEKLGLVKMDLLGVRSLSIITDCIREVTRDPEKHKKRSFAGRGVPDFFLRNSATLSPLDLRTIPEDDPEVTAFIRSGLTLGCFQLESPAMRGLIRKMLIEGVEDVITAVALIRPGASGAGGGMKELYIKRRAGMEPTEYIHPSLEPALGETYGVSIYQEQVLQMAHHVAGLSFAEGDTLRRAMTKSRNRKEFLKVHQAFVDGAVSRGLSPEQAEQVWQFLYNFSGYGFNKAHSATYGTIAYQTAFLKYYFPVEYMCAVLNNHGGFYSRSAYIEEARRMRIPLLPPDVNRSQREFSVENNAIRCGLEPVFELTERTIKAILKQREEREFVDLFDFIRRTRAGDKEVGNLIKAGALGSIHPSQPQLMLLKDLFFKNNKKAPVATFVAGSTRLPQYNTYQRVLNEITTLDFALSDHPLCLFEEQLNGQTFVASNALEEHGGKTIHVCGWLVTSRRVNTRGNQFMKFLTLEDRLGLMEVVLFPKTYARCGHVLRSHGPYIVRGKVQSRLPGEANIIADDVQLVEVNKHDLEELLNQRTVHEYGLW